MTATQDSESRRLVRERMHLTKRTPENHQAFGINSPREFYCRSCGARITVTPEGLEAGHRSGDSERCPYRPEEFDL